MAQKGLEVIRKGYRVTDLPSCKSKSNFTTLFIRPGKGEIIRERIIFSFLCLDLEALEWVSGYPQDQFC